MRFDEAPIERGDRGRRLTYEDAMGSDLTNAIIELVTNADDSYCALEDRGELHDQARIRIEIARSHTESTVLRVKDRAEGLSRAEMRERLQQEGELHREFQPGNRKRGMFGSGAKEVSHFGDTVFESIKDGTYTRYEIPRGGGSKSKAPRIGSESPDRHREEMGVPRGNGTVVTIYVDSQQFTIPLYDTLRRRLQTAPQLQPILQDDQRWVELVDLKNPENEHRLLVVEPESESIIDGEELDVPGYQEAIETIGQPVVLTLNRAPEPLEEMAGVLIRAGRTAFERDQLGLTNQAHADRFYGELDCPLLWRLIAEAEARDAEDPSLLPQGEDDEYLIERSLNPSRPISRRRRSGLDRTHPFIRRLREVLRPKVNSERQRSVSQLATPEKPEKDEELQRELSEIASRLGEFLKGERGEDEPEPFRVVPGSLRLDEGVTEFFSVLATTELVEAEGVHVEVVVIEGEECVELEANEQELEEREEYFSATFHVTGIETGSAHLLIALGGETKTLRVRVGAPEEEDELEDLLSFDRNQYSVRADGSRAANVEVRVADRLRDEIEADTVSLSLGGAEGISEAVTLARPAPQIVRNDDGLWVGQSRLAGGRGGAGLTGQLTANYGHMSVTARVRVTGEEEPVGDSLPFEIDYEPNIEARKRRYTWDLESEPEVLKILTEHPSVEPFYEDSVTEENRVRLTPQLQTVTREIAASAVAYRRVEEESWPETPRPEAILAEYEQVLERALRYLYGG